MGKRIKQKLDPEERAFRIVGKAIEKKDKDTLRRFMKGIADDKSGGVLEVFTEKKLGKDNWL